MGESGQLSSFAEFESAVACLPLETSDALRAEFVATFVDTSRPRFPELIGHRRHFVDGDFYTGYLWDFLTNFTLVTEEQVWSNVASLGTEIDVMWDLHSSERIHRTTGTFRDMLSRGQQSNTWRSIFSAGRSHLFDETFVWCAALTHEYSDDSGERICLFARAA